MGKNLGRMLRRTREQNNLLQCDMVDATGIPAPRLSEIENGKTPSCSQLSQLADGYGIPYSELVRLWLTEQLDSDDAKDRLIAEVFPSRGQGTKGPTSVGLDAIASNRRLHRAARHVVEEMEKGKRALDTTTLKLLDALRRLPEVNVEEGKAPKCVRINDAKWLPLGPDGKSKIQKCTVFAVKRPTPLVVELHRLASKIAGLHRQAHLPSRPAYYELWSLVSGRGLLLIEEESAWTEYVVGAGDCGSYWSGHRHIWVNLDHRDPLIVYHIFFPYRSGGLEVGGPGEAMEFRHDDIPDTVPEGAQQALVQALKRFKTRA